MVLKIRSKGKVKYKSSKRILTPNDIKNADKFDSRLKKVIDQIEKTLIEKNLLSETKYKKDPLKSWYIIGTQINKFLEYNKLPEEDKALFWEDLYTRSQLINKKSTLRKVGLTRNDFKTSSLLARFAWDYVRRVGTWALWREILSYKVFQDKRILEWTIEELLNYPRTRDEARPLLRGVAKRFKRMDTSYLSNHELKIKLKDVKE